MAQIKEKAKEIALSSSILGLPNVISKKNIFFKILWLVAFLGSASVGIVSVQKTISSYLKYEVVTKIDVINEKYHMQNNSIKCFNHKVWFIIAFE